MVRNPPVDTPAQASIWDAWQRYDDRLRALAAIRPCLSYWPPDPPGPDSLGTRCDLVAGHDRGERPTPHRHRPKGAGRAVLVW